MSNNALSVALTGGTGFVGRHVLSRLLAAGHHVRLLLRDPRRFDPRSLESTGRVTAPAVVTPVPGDLFQDTAIRELVRGADAVVHLIGIIREQPRAGQTFQRVHVEATGRLLAAAREAGVKHWVHMSALGTRENAVSRYHQTKWQAELAVRDSGIPWTIFQPSIIHGPDGEFMQMVRSFWCGWFPPVVPYFGAGLLGRGGAGHLQPVWVEDVARCFVDALTNPRTRGKTYGLGGPDIYSWPQLYRTCRRYLPCAKAKPIVAIPVWKARLLARLPGAPFNLDQVIMSQEESTCDLGPLQEDFGFMPAGFEETVATYWPLPAVNRAG